MRAVAVALQIGVALQDQCFHVFREPEVGGRKDRIDPLARVLKHRVSKVVDEIDVVARATDHDVGPTFAVEDITAAVAEECVAPAVAVPLQVGIALQDQVFQVP